MDDFRIKKEVAEQPETKGKVGTHREDDHAPKAYSLGQPRALVQPLLETPSPSVDPLAHVVLYQPQIPQNTGNIGRSCVATGSMLWIVQPAAFQIDEKKVRRAGLDYWQYLHWREVASWGHLTERLPPSRHRYWYFSRFARQTIWDAGFAAGDVVVFGSETSGLPKSICNSDTPTAVRLPTNPEVRSLNLSSTVAVVLYEMMRRREVPLPVALNPAATR